MSHTQELVAGKVAIYLSCKSKQYTANPATPFRLSYPEAIEVARLITDVEPLHKTRDTLAYLSSVQKAINQYGFLLKVRTIRDWSIRVGAASGLYAFVHYMNMFLSKNEDEVPFADRLQIMIYAGNLRKRFLQTSPKHFI